jgi:hypothetical protein
LLGKQYALPMTRSEAYRAGVRAIVQGSKPGTFLHGFSPAGLGAGLYHGTRTGDDTGPHWQADKHWCWGPKNQAAMSARRYYLNHRVYLLDPDAFYFGHPATLKRWGISEPLPLATSQAWATLVAMTGSMVKVGAAFVDLKPEELAVVRKVLPINAVSARPLDLFTRQYPRLWQLKAAADNSWQVLAVFDWDEPGESGSLTLGEEVGLGGAREYIAYNFWAERAFTFSGALTANPARRGCMVLAIHPVLGRPQYLATDRHVTQGALTLVSERWHAGNATLSGTMKADPGTEQTLIFYVPPTKNGRRSASRFCLPNGLAVSGAAVIGTRVAGVWPQGGAPDAQTKQGIAYAVEVSASAPQIGWRLKFPRSAF